MVKFPTLLSLALLPAATLAQGPPTPEPKDWETSPPYEWLFEDELDIPPVKTPKVVDGVHYYEVVINEFQVQLYKDGRGPTKFVGYDSVVPGPTIKQKKGVRSVLRTINNSTAEAAVHLHGANSRAPFDGWAEDLIHPGQFKDYYYSNEQTPRTIWYHDHAMDHTAEHNYFGQFGQYHIVDEHLERKLKLPQGQYDVPLSITSAQFNDDGTLWSPDANNERLSLFGDVIFVNGRPWPKMTVEPRKYRFRLLDATASRSFLLYLEEEAPAVQKRAETTCDGKTKFYKSVRPGTVTDPDPNDGSDGCPGDGGNGGGDGGGDGGNGGGDGGNGGGDGGGDGGNGGGDGGNGGGDPDPPFEGRIPFTVVASDSGFLSAPVPVTELYLSMAERYEIIVDFSSFAGKKITLRNERGFTDDLDYLHTDKVMQFHVKDGKTVDSSSVPNSLVSINYPRPAGEREGDGAARTFRFAGAPGVGWTINGVRFDDVANRVLAKPARGAVERWTFVNTSPRFSHPIHVHLVDFRVISRSGSNRTVFPYETQGLKDVVWLAGGETVVVDAVFSPWAGVYMFHCHNLIHEDHAMMGVFNTSLLADFGYEENLHFVDPLDPAFAAVNCDIEGDLPGRTGPFSDAEIKTVVKGLKATEAYKDIAGVEAALEEYWAAPVPAPAPANLTRRRVSRIRSAKFRV